MPEKNRINLEQLIKQRTAELKELALQLEGKEKMVNELLIYQEKAEAKIAVINKESQYNRNLLEASLDPLFALGPDGIITDVNAAVEIATGLPGETLIGTDYAEYFTEPEKARAGYRKVIEDGKVLDYELKLKHISGYTTPVLFNASLYKDDEGNTIGVFAAARDITASRKFEDELIYLKSNLERLVKQRTVELHSANKELAAQSEEKDKRAAELLIADDELVFQKEEKEKREAELLIANLELAFQNEEKEKRATELIAANKELAYQNQEKEKRADELLTANKELAFQNEEKEKRAAELYFANQDLAIQKEKIVNLNSQLENRVIERTAQLESANKELEALSYSISHDLKAPLRHITGYVALLVKKYRDLFPEEGRHYIDVISLSAKEMGELIEGLLQFSRTGNIEMHKTLLNTNKIVEDLIQPTREQDTEHRIEFNIEPMPLIFADLEMIKSVWNNFIENAVKFTRKKDLAKISIGAKENEIETVFYIKDNGAGFDMNYVSKLFAVFQRLHSREEYEGTGIGLATVKKIIDRHGGRTRAEGKLGEGATFYFSLPKRKGSDQGI
ncbi:MAG: ATP-binding protein [Eubacteriales bacterium]